MNTENKYGKTPFNPIRMTGIYESLMFLNSLTFSNNKPIFYHRIHTTSIGKSKPIDCYEIFKQGEFKEILFIDTYANEKSEEIPEGYLRNTEIIKTAQFKNSCISRTVGVNYKLRKFPDKLI